MNMKICGLHNIRKHRDIKNDDNYITVDISLNFGSLYKIKITSSELKEYWVRSGKGVITCMGIKAIIRSNKNKKARYAISNFILNDISKIIY